MILGCVQETANLAQLTNSSDKLADIFTPRSRRHAEAKLDASNCNDDKLAEIDNSVPVRRHSSRLSAKAAASAIARTLEVTAELNFAQESSLGI